MSAKHDSSTRESRPEFVKMEEEFSFASRHGTEVGDDPVFDELYDYAAKLRTENAKLREAAMKRTCDAAGGTHG